MAVKASAIITLVYVSDGTGYTVLLSNESYSFAAGVSAALAGSTVTNIEAYKNTSQMAATVSKIGSTTVSGNSTGIATGFTGLTADVTGNGTTSCKITFKATTALTTKSGNVEIVINVDGKSFTKVFSFSLSLRGEQGQAGKPGDPTGIIESATAPTTKYTGMLWKHTGAVSGLIKDATYRWSGTAWELFKFRADNIEAESFDGFQFNGAIFRSEFSRVSGKMEDNLYHKYEGNIEIRGDAINLSYSESTSTDQKTWTIVGMHSDIISSNGLAYRMFNQNGTLIGDTLVKPGAIYCNGDNIMSMLYELNQNLQIKQDSLSKGIYSGNINSILTSGTHWCPSGGVTGTLPFNDFFTLITLSPATNSAIQFAMPFSTANSPKWRMYVNAGWQAWRNF
jgi:hypothetical protein